MSELFNSLTIPFLLPMFLAITMGGSGTAPAFSAAYGANVVKTVKRFFIAWAIAPVFAYRLTFMLIKCSL